MTKAVKVERLKLLKAFKFSPGQKETSELINFFEVVRMLAASIHIHGILVILFLNFPFFPLLHLCNVGIRVREMVPAALDRVDKAWLRR